MASSGEKRKSLFDIPQIEEKRRKMREEQPERLISQRGHERDMKEVKPWYMQNTATIPEAMQEHGYKIKPVDTSSDESTSIMSVAISERGDKTAFGCSCSSVYYTDETRKMTRFLTSGFTNAVAFTNDGENIIAGTNNGIDIFDTNTKKSIPIVSVGERWVTSIAVHPARNDMFVAGHYNRGAIKVFNMTDGIWTLAATLRHSNAGVGFNSVNSVAFSLDGTHFYSGGSDGSVTVWDCSSRDGQIVRDGRIVHIDDPGSFGTVNSLVSTPEHIISAGGDGVIKVWGKSDGDLKSSTICVPISETRGLSINHMAYKDGMLAVAVERWGNPSTYGGGDNVFLYTLDSNGVLTLTQQFRGPTPFKSVAIGPYFGIGARGEFGKRNGIDIKDDVIVLGATGGIKMSLTSRGSRAQMYWLYKGVKKSDEGYEAAAARRLPLNTDEKLGTFGKLFAKLTPVLREEITDLLGGKRSKRRRKTIRKQNNKQKRTSKRR